MRAATSATPESNPTYTITFKPVARREFDKLPRQAQIQLQPVIDALAANPRPHNVVKLKDKPNLYRVRSGDYRIVYQIQDAALVVLVIEIGNRKEIYR